LAEGTESAARTQRAVATSAEVLAGQAFGSLGATNALSEVETVAVVAPV